MPSPSDVAPGRQVHPGLEVHPFRALTYADRSPGYLARVSSPAHDPVGPAGRSTPAAAHPHSVVRLILPGGADVAGGPEDDRDASPARAAATLRAWRAAGVLVTDPAAALWCYRMRDPVGEESTGWLGAVELPSAGSTAVLPHEDVFAPAVVGRRALLAATGTDLEPIVLAHDTHVGIARATAATLDRPVDLLVTDQDGVRHELRRVDDPAVLDRLVSGFGAVASVIADGHHRYAAARAHAAGFPGRVLALLTPIGPGGLRVRAIHRVVPTLDLDQAAGLASAGFRVEPVDVPAGGTVDEVAADWVRHAGADLFLATDGVRLVRLAEPVDAVRDRVPGGAPPSWRALDVVLAHHGLLTGLWGIPDDPASMLVAHDVAEALWLARDRAGVALLLRASSPADVAAVARAGVRMPRKSTLFVPKPRSGLVLRPH